MLDPGLLARARDAMWQSIPEGPLRRSEPASWIGPFANDEHPGQDLSDRASGSGRPEPRFCTAVAIAD